MLETPWLDFLELRRSGHTRHFYLLYFAKWRMEGVTQGGFGPFFSFMQLKKRNFCAKILSINSASVSFVAKVDLNYKGLMLEKRKKVNLVALGLSWFRPHWHFSSHWRGCVQEKSFVPLLCWAIKGVFALFVKNMRYLNLGFFDVGTRYPPRTGTNPFCDKSI